MRDSVKILTTTINIAILIIIISIIAILFIKKTDYIEARGKLMVNKYLNIYSSVNGRILKVSKDFGDRVKKNEEILVLDRKESEIVISEDKMRLNDISIRIRERMLELNNIKTESEDLKGKRKIKEIELAGLKEEYLGLKYLFNMGEKTKHELSSFEHRIKIKEIEIENMKNDENQKIKEELLLKNLDDLKQQQEYYIKKIENDEQELGNSVIKSEGDNLTIVTMNLKEIEGSIVKKGDLLLSMVDTTHLKMVVRIEESDIGKIKVGQKSKIFLDAIPYERFSVIEGQVTKIYPQIKGDNDTYNMIELQIFGFSNKLELDSAGVFTKYPNNLPPNLSDKAISRSAKLILPWCNFISPRTEAGALVEPEDKLKNIASFNPDLRDGLKGSARIIISDNKTIFSYLCDTFFSLTKE